MNNNYLKKFRESTNYSVDFLAKILNITSETYIRYEEGIEEIPLSLLEKLAIIYDSEVFDILTGRVKNYCIELKETDDDQTLKSLLKFKDFITYYNKTCRMSEEKTILPFVEKELDVRVPNAKLLYLTVRGSRAYGTNTESSDFDYAGIFVQPIDEILTSNLVETVHIVKEEDKVDVVLYSIQKYMNLLSNGNPNIIELMYTDPVTDVVYLHDAFKELLSHKDEFLTKNIRNSFLGYANAELRKAKGLNKKINWEKDRVQRKDILDFINVIYKGKSISIRKYYECVYFSEKQQLSFKHFIESIGIKKIHNARDLYAAYLIPNGKGIVKLDLDDTAISTELRLTEIPKDQEEYPLFLLSYNQDAFTQHCISYREYKDWLEHKNDSRYVKTDNQYIDGKCMMHCMRLLNMAKEIAEGKGVVVRRPDAEYLLSIRYGKHSYPELMTDMNNKFQEIKILFEKSNLRNSSDSNLKNKLLNNIVKCFYTIEAKH